MWNCNKKRTAEYQKFLLKGRRSKAFPRKGEGIANIKTKIRICLPDANS